MHKIKSEFTFSTKSLLIIFLREFVFLQCSILLPYKLRQPSPSIFFWIQHCFGFFFFLLPLYFVLITITLHLNGVMQGTLLFLLDSGFSDLGTNWEHISLETWNYIPFNFLFKILFYLNFIWIMYYSASALGIVKPQKYLLGIMFGNKIHFCTIV